MDTLISNDCLEKDLKKIEKAAQFLREQGYIFGARVLEVKLLEFREQIKKMDAAITRINSCSHAMTSPALVEHVEDLKARVYVQFTDGRIHHGLIAEFEAVAQMVK